MASKKSATPKAPAVSQAQAEDAIRLLLRWAGDNPEREGLLDTPKRVAKAYKEWFGGYDMHPENYLKRTFEEVEGYDEMVILRDIEFESHCEHHMAPIIGVAHVGYAKRLQVQEKMTAQIARCIQDVLKPKGVGVVIVAKHECMTTRGVHKTGVSMVTSKLLGSFRDDARTRAEFLQCVGMK